MGKSKPTAKGAPPKAAKPKGMSSAVLLGAALAVGAGYFFLSGSAVPLPARAAMPAGGAARPGETEAQRKRRHLQEGRVDPDLKRPGCTDSWTGGCGSVTAATCESDAALKSACCLSCHKLTCLDTDANCVDWAQSGECYKNTDFMLQTCCHSCSPDYDDKCTHYPTERPDVAEGDISKIFERAVANYPQYSPTVLSRDPWVVTFDNLLSDEETTGILEAVMQ